MNYWKRATFGYIYVFAVQWYERRVRKIKVCLQEILFELVYSLQSSIANKVGVNSVKFRILVYPNIMVLLDVRIILNHTFVI